MGVVWGILHEGAGRKVPNRVQLETVSVANIIEMFTVVPDRMYGKELRVIGSDGHWYRTRISGKLRQWKTDRSRIELPVKYGLKTSMTLTAHDFNTGRVAVVLNDRMANPSRGVAGVIPGDVEKLFYQRRGNHPGPYQHKFGRGAIMLAMDNGDVVLKSTRGRRLWTRQ